MLSAGIREWPELPVGSLYTNDACLLGFEISNAAVDDLARAAVVINQRLADNTLSAPIADTIPLARTGEAHRRVERGETSGTRLLRCPQ